MKRIFWLGAHKLLVKTELVRLRTLGYEVFNPPYNSEICDQSANLNWDADQYSTLPKEVFDKLKSFNFFYNYISADIAVLLNKYFDAVIVTIHPWWLAEVLRVYQGTVIYRTYGQNEILSEQLMIYKAIPRIVNRQNFHFLPFHRASLSGEDNWLAAKAVIVPYCLDPSILERKDKWQITTEKNSKIMVSCPNINNPFYLDHYRYLKKHFSDDTYCFFGVQLAAIKDPQVVGTIAYASLTEFFEHASGYMYTYPNARVCFLPPVEMMFVGGPVIYPVGSLLDSMMPNGAGAFKNELEAKLMVKKLIDKDTAFIAQLQQHQKTVVNYYHPDFVWPIFDRVISGILEALPAPAGVDEKFEITLVKDEFEARKFMQSNFKSSNKANHSVGTSVNGRAFRLYSWQDVVANILPFSIINKILMHRMSGSVNAFSKRIEAGEFIQDLIAYKPSTESPISQVGSDLQLSPYSPSGQRMAGLPNKIKTKIKTKLILLIPRIKKIVAKPKFYYTAVIIYIWQLKMKIKGHKISNI